jgi:hypothetical protein
MSHELFILLATASPKEVLFEKIEEAIAEYKEAKLLGKDLKDAENSIGFACHLMITNLITKGELQGSMEMINKMKEMKQREDFFKMDKNLS